jgi:PIN domain
MRLGTIGDVTTATELLARRTESLRERVHDLLGRSGVRQMNPLRGDIIFVGPTGFWEPHDIEGQRLQSEILEDYSRLHDTIGVLLTGQSETVREDLEEASVTLRDLVEQTGGTWMKTTDEAIRAADAALDAHLSLLERLHERGSGAAIYVPDTNALLAQPNLERWTFADASAFEILLVPTILVELDELKINHRNEAVRDKAEGLIRRIKGYRGRGQLTKGVPLHKPLSTIRALATEPRMGDSLPWLDPYNRDDKFLASIVEIIRQHPRSPVTIVTLDINMQNKAEMASLPFVEPPEVPV